MALRQHARVLVAALAVVATGALGIVSTGTASASTGIVKAVVNADGGVYWRAAPRWDAVIKVNRQGVYNGDRIELECYFSGNSANTVPPYWNNSLWYQVKIVSGYGIGSGWLNDHFINTGTNVPNQPVRGVPACGPNSVFYSPNESPDGVANITVADLNLVLDDWSAGACSPSLAIDIPNDVHILAGWSKGRLGPIYFLSAAGAQRVAQVHTIVLFDPGGTSDFANPPAWKRALGDTTCDWRFNINSLLANWLKSNVENRLIVLSAIDSEEKNSNGQSTFAGLWKYYFAGIWNQPFANRAQVCDYNNLGHSAVLADFHGIVEDPAPGCPTNKNAPKPVAWNP